MPRADRLLTLILLSLFVSAGALAQDAVPLGDTGFTFVPPPGWERDPGVSGDLLYRASGPGGLGFLEVYHGRGTLSVEEMIRGYEERMSAAVSGWRSKSAETARVDGAETTFRRYGGVADGAALDICALFVRRGAESFILHVIVDESRGGALLRAGENALRSLRGPAPEPPGGPEPDRELPSGLTMALIAPTEEEFDAGSILYTPLYGTGLPGFEEIRARHAEAATAVISQVLAAAEKTVAWWNADESWRAIGDAIDGRWQEVAEAHREDGGVVELYARQKAMRLREVAFRAEAETAAIQLMEVFELLAEAAKSEAGLPANESLLQSNLYLLALDRLAELAAIGERRAAEVLGRSVVLHAFASEPEIFAPAATEADLGGLYEQEAAVADAFHDAQRALHRAVAKAAFRLGAVEEIGLDAMSAALAAAGRAERQLAQALPGIRARAERGGVDPVVAETAEVSHHFLAVQISRFSTLRDFLAWRIQTRPALSEDPIRKPVLEEGAGGEDAWFVVAAMEEGFFARLKRKVVDGAKATVAAAKSGAKMVAGVAGDALAYGGKQVGKVVRTGVMVLDVTSQTVADKCFGNESPDNIGYLDRMRNEWQKPWDQVGEQGMENLRKGAATAVAVADVATEAGSQALVNKWYGTRPDWNAVTAEMADRLQNPDESVEKARESYRAFNEDYLEGKFGKTGGMFASLAVGVLLPGVTLGNDVLTLTSTKTTEREKQIALTGTLLSLTGGFLSGDSAKSAVEAGARGALKTAGEVAAGTGSTILKGAGGAADLTRRVAGFVGKSSLELAEEVGKLASGLKDKLLDFARGTGTFGEKLGDLVRGPITKQAVKTFVGEVKEGIVRGSIETAEVLGTGTANVARKTAEIAGKAALSTGQAALRGGEGMLGFGKTILERSGEKLADTWTGMKAAAYGLYDDAKQVLSGAKLRETMKDPQSIFKMLEIEGSTETVAKLGKSALTFTTKKATGVLDSWATNYVLGELVFPRNLASADPAANAALNALVNSMGVTPADAPVDVAEVLKEAIATGKIPEKGPDTPSPDTGGATPPAPPTPPEPPPGETAAPDYAAPILPGGATKSSTTTKDGERVETVRVDGKTVAETRWFQNGQKEWEHFFDPGTGEKHGKWTTWNEKGEVTEVQGWRFGKEHGLTVRTMAGISPWREDGYREGKRHGPSREYGPGQVLLEESFFRDGLRHGISRSRFADGKLRSEAAWKEGKKHGAGRTWAASGQLIREENWRDDRQEGIQRAWDPTTGMPSSMATFVAGVQEGPAWSWSLTSVTASVWTGGKALPATPPGDDLSMEACEAYAIGGGKEYSGTLPDGRRATAYFADDRTFVGSRVWYANGKLQSESPYHADLPHGPQLTFFENGKPKTAITYRHGERFGLERIWNEAGHLVSERRVRDGRWEGVAKSFDSRTGKLLTEFRCRGGEVEYEGRYDAGTGKLSREAVYDLEKGRGLTGEEADPRRLYGHWTSPGRPVVVRDFDPATGELRKLTGTDADGKPDGPQSESRADGTPLREEEYAHGVKVMAKKFGEDGALVAEEHYDAAGEKDGVFRTWFEAGPRKGKPSIEQGWSHGAPDGPYREWDYGQDRLRVEGKYVAGKKDGKWTKYQDGGVLAEETTYVADRIEGEQVFYFHDHGRPRQRMPWRNGQLHGVGEEYDYTTGKVVQRTSFHLGQQTGPVIRYDENGKQTSVTYWFNGGHVGEKGYRELLAKDPSLPPMVEGK